MSTQATLTQLNPDRIKANPDNPRLVFRENEMNQLLESIKEVGIQVPLTVYAERSHWVLIDGERRWRCSRRLNLKEVPAIVQPKPGKLENILMMFNIHNVRTDWDLMPMALKLDEVRNLLVAQGRKTGAKDLSGITGVTVPTVSRALELLELPPRYRTMLLKEAEKPKDEQKITPDLFIEINKSRRVVESYAPEVFKQVTHAEYLDSMIDKYRNDVVNNVVRYRDVSKIARAERAGGDRQTAAPAIVRLVKEPSLRIERAYEETVRDVYDARDLSTRVDGVLERLRSIQHGRALSSDLRAQLRSLRKEIERLLGAH